jgi:short-subunit dehydrogenase
MVTGYARATSFWHGKHVLITGASSGLGWALAEHVAAQGAAVGLLARRGDRLAALAERVRASGGRAATAAADVGDVAAVRAAVAALRTELGPVDVLVANAGTHRYTPGYAFCAEDVTAVWRTNVLGVVHALDAVLPEMVRRRTGHVAAIASIAGMLGLPDVGAYSSGKAALITLLESLRVDLHPYGVAVTTVCPGFVDTPFIAGHDRRVLKFMLTPEDAARRTAAAIAAGRGVVYFPWPTWLTARIARLLPFGAYRRIVSRVALPAGVEQGA